MASTAIERSIKYTLRLFNRNWRICDGFIRWQTERQVEVGLEEKVGIDFKQQGKACERVNEKTREFSVRSLVLSWKKNHCIHQEESQLQVFSLLGLSPLET